VRRTMLVLALAALIATMMALAGPSLAKDTDQKQKTYTNNIEARQYLVLPPSGDDVRGSGFRGSATPLEDEDSGPGLPGYLDTRVTYTGGVPIRGGTNDITGGAWMLCSQFTAPPRDPNTGQLIDPECTSDSRISLKGTWIRGTATWRDEPAGDSSCLREPVYAGVADVKGDLTVTGGKVNNKTVKEGTGKFEGTIDHRPLALPMDQYPCLVNGRPNPERAPIVTGTMDLKF
jgi:hypothetical protein